MPASTILDTVRQPLATAFASVAGNVYAYVPEAPMVPFVFVEWQQARQGNGFRPIFENT